MRDLRQFGVVEGVGNDEIEIGCSARKDHCDPRIVLDVVEQPSQALGPDRLAVFLVKRIDSDEGADTGSLARGVQSAEELGRLRGGEEDQGLAGFDPKAPLR